MYNHALICLNPKKVHKDDLVDDSISLNNSFIGIDNLHLINTAVTLKNKYNFQLHAIIINFDIELKIINEMIRHILFNNIDIINIVKIKNNKKQLDILNPQQYKKIICESLYKFISETSTNYDLIFLNYDTNNTYSIGMHLSQKLNIVQSCCVEKIINIDSNKIEIIREFENCKKLIQLSMPSLLNIKKENINKNNQQILSSKKIMKYENIINQKNDFTNIIYFDINDIIKKISNFENDFTSIKINKKKITTKIQDKIIDFLINYNRK